MVSKKKVIKKLETVMDPELHISIVDLGLIYKVTFTRKKLNIVMTLTTIGCPLFGTIETEIKEVLKDLKIAEKNINLELTFEPPWDMERMSPRGRAMLGI
ncbi:hypothetical protein COY90_02620 [Candidatus Roizmanbacteria bacterium CG_4_10_14_0_8_um_filter_39_9]|uniref:MIP18 family-like domain-containing protein n=1 Tax=Candidatus Roizmanbacteria bacterium CG_4_10_14_0_8_um_filter_39_9 TaxID=1974829 RepID=A0A2M7QE11_9BACT|nr:MAG: hypothetical protein COY90_02620 [Candidatus Roizmanbacteria bacterium CG_4_10_14_0_8_um_filter_39_9]